MLIGKQTRKIDLSYLQFLTDEDLTSNVITLDDIRKDYKHTKKSDLEAYKLLYALNFKNLSEHEKTNLESIIKHLTKKEEDKFNLAFEKYELTEIK